MALTAQQKQILREKIASGQIMLSKREDKMTQSFRASVDRSIRRKQRNNHPVARYDIAARRAYLEYPDGSRRYVDDE